MSVTQLFTLTHIDIAWQHNVTFPHHKVQFAFIVKKGARNN